MSATQIKNVGWWHERLADWLIANPHSTLAEAAKFFDCSRAWISIVKNSDAFKAFFAERSGNASDAILVGIREKLASVAELALEEMESRLETEAGVMPFAEIEASANLALKGLGYSANAKSAPPGVSTSVTVNVDAALLATAREQRSRLYGGAQEVNLLPQPLPRIETSEG